MDQMPSNSQARKNGWSGEIPHGYSELKRKHHRFYILKMLEEERVKTVLVTGGYGYVGSVLLPKLVEDGWKVKNLDLMLYRPPNMADQGIEHIKGDIRDLNTVKQALEGVDAVIHLACISNDPSFELDPGLGKSINLDAFEPLVRSAKEAGVKRFINASSSSVYGVKDEPEVTEEVSCAPLTDYSRYKMMTEQMLNTYAGGGLTTTSVRSATVCGYSPRQRPRS